MVAGNPEESALGSARGRFLESLPRKALELRGAVAQLLEDPAADAPREDLRRRLHALYASALVFRNVALADAVQEGIDRLDAAREAARPLTASDLEVLRTLVERLPDLRDDRPGQFDPRDLDYENNGNGNGNGEHDHAGVNGAIRPSEPVPGQPLLQRILQLLLLAEPSEEAALRALLRSDCLHVIAVADVAALIAHTKDAAPDLVLADERLAHEGRLAERLHDEAAADFVPLVVFESAAGELGHDVAGVDARVARPLRAPQLVQAIGRATGTLIGPIEPLGVGDVTLEELAVRVGRDVERGLVDAAERGRALRMPLGNGTEVLAVTQEAISALRAAVVRESAGRVQFEARPRRGGLSLVTIGQHPPVLHGERRLNGRRVVLVEDDTAVALLLANLLRAQGATVHEFTEGREARDAAQRERPDLVITGARVPNLDGFSLCRELARDPLLADVPVLLLPAREQLLVRPKELPFTTQLNGAVVEQVVSSAERLLRPRAELEARLRRAGAVRGSLEGTGIIPLLRSVRRARPDARIRVRDAWNLFECELRDGKLAQVTRTASDGSFVRNERALPQLLGALAGHFSVVSVDAPMKDVPAKLAFEGTLDEVLTRGARELAAELDAVSGARLARIARVVFDEEAYASLIEQTPRPVRQVIERLYTGDAPSKLLKAGLVEADVLEPILTDMARRGALRGVIGSAGEDLVAEARAVRAREVPTELASPFSLMPPPPNPVISMLPSFGHELAVSSLLDPRLDGPELPPVALPGVQRASLGRVDTSTPPGFHRVSSLPASQINPPEPPRPVVPLSSRPPRDTIDATEVAAAAAEARRSRSMLAAWTAGLALLVALGFWIAREPGSGSMPVEAIGGPAPAPAATAPAPEPQPAAAPLAPRPQGAALTAAEENGFAVYDGILDDTARVPRGHALLVVEANPELSDATVFLNDRELGAAPQKLPLPEGVHELAIQRGDAISYRFVSVHPGRTWVLRSP